MGTKRSICSNKRAEANDIGLCMNYGSLDFQITGVRATGNGELWFVFDTDNPMEHLE